MTDPNKYNVGNVNLFHIRNRNEVRVVAEMPRVLSEFPDFIPNDLDMEDIYALALNSLPPRYVQHGAIVLNEPVKDEMIREALRKAVGIVRERPTK